MSGEVSRQEISGRDVCNEAYAALGDEDALAGAMRTPEEEGPRRLKTSPICARRARRHDLGEGREELLMKTSTPKVKIGHSDEFQVNAVKAIEDGLVTRGVGADFKKDGDTPYVEFDWRCLLLPQLVLVSLMLASVVSCSRAFWIKVDGRFQEDVRFVFYRFEGDVTPATLRVVEFVVQEQVPGELWRTVWELRGGRRLDSIEYGAPYEGLNEIVPAQPLRGDARYRALASELSWPNPKGHSATVFEFSADGFVISE